MVRYYTPNQVGEHNTVDSCWVTYFMKVYDLTALIKEHKGIFTKPILKFAGQDITHWFDPSTKQPKTYIHPKFGVEMAYTPYGRYVHIPPEEPTVDWDTSFGTPWWTDEKYFIGILTKKPRTIRIINTLTAQEDHFEVCAEETLENILDRYTDYNSHAKSYTWKRLGRPLNMQKTLEENDIMDESEEMAKLLIDEDNYIPALHLYFNDDLTVG